MALVVPPVASRLTQIDSVPAWISLHDVFSIQGTGFRGDADADLVRIAGKQALVLAASPVSLVLLANPQTEPGTAALVLQTGTGEVTASVALVGIALQPDLSSLVHGQHATLQIRALGTEQARDIQIRNLAPDVLRLHGGNFQKLRTSGGAENIAQLDVQARREGDSSLDVRIIPPLQPPDIDAARAFLSAAAPHAGGDAQRRISGWARRLGAAPPDTLGIPADIEKELNRAKNAEEAALLRAALDNMQGIAK